ncbi:MAG: EamA family transporter, partial [Calditrichia bacterium]
LLVLRQRSRIDFEVIGGGLLLGIPNYFSAYFILEALKRIPAPVAFPLNNIGIIVLGALTGIVVWNEHLKPRTIAAMVLSVVAVILLNMR